MKDVSGQELNVGDKVAYCIGGRGTVMRVGTVLRMTAKSVIIEGTEPKFTWDGNTWTADGLVDVIRAFDAVSRIAQ